MCLAFCELRLTAPAKLGRYADRNDPVPFRCRSATARVLRTSPLRSSPKFALLNLRACYPPRSKKLQLRDAPSIPLWCNGGRRYIRYKVEALNPVLWKLGTQKGLGSQWCNRLPSISQEDGGGRGCDRHAGFASYLTDVSPRTL